MSSPVPSAASIRKTVPPGLHSRSNIEDTVQQITISSKIFFSVRSEIKLRRQTNLCKQLCVKSHSVQKISASIIQSVRCGAAGQSQTQTVTRESSTITVAPQAKEKSPELDDGGSGLPPRDDDDGGGGGGGGGGWGGGFFFFGFLALLGFLKDQEDEGSYQDSRRRSKNY